MTDIEINDLFEKRLNHWEREAPNFLSNIKNYRDMYLNRYESRLMSATKSKIKSGRVHGLMRKVVARVTSGQIIGAYTPCDDNISASQDELNQDFKHWAKKIKLNRKAKAAARRTVNYGFQAYSLLWNPIKVPEYSKQKTLIDVTEANCVLKLYKPTEIIFNPSYDPIDDYWKKGEWVIVKQIMSIDYLESVNKAATEIEKKGEKPMIKYQNLGKLKELAKNAVAKDTKKDAYIKSSSQVRKNSTSPDSDYDTSVDTVMVEFMFTGENWYGRCPEMDNLVILDTENPIEIYRKLGWLPVNIAYMEYDDESPIGISKIEQIQDMADWENTLLSQRADASEYNMKPTFVYEGGDPSENIFFKYGATIYTKPNTRFSQLQLADTSAQTFQLNNQLIGEKIQQTIGYIDNAVSPQQATALQDTATGVQQAAQEVDLLIQDDIQNFIDSFVEPIGEMYLLLTQTFEKKNRTIAVDDKQSIKYFQSKVDDQSESFDPNYTTSIDGKTKPKFRMDKNGKIGYLTVTPEDRAGNYIFEVDTQSLGRDSVAEKRDSAEFDAWITNPVVLQGLQQEGKVVSFYEVTEKKAQALNIKGFEDIIINKDELIAQQQSQNPQATAQDQMMQQQQAMQPPMMPQGQMPMQGAPMPMQQPMQPQQPQIDPRVMQVIQAIQSGQLNQNDPRLQQDPIGQQALQIIMQQQNHG